MPRGEKSKYTDKQKRQAAHIEESYEERGSERKKSPGDRLGHGEQRVRGREKVRLGQSQAPIQAIATSAQISVSSDGVAERAHSLRHTFAGICTGLT